MTVVGKIQNGNLNFGGTNVVIFVFMLSGKKRGTRGNIIICFS